MKQFSLPAQAGNLTIVAILITLYFILYTPVLASSIDISTKPSEVNMREEFAVRLNTTGLTPATTYRLRIAFYKETGKYFGETWNGASWVGTEDGVNPQYYYGILTDKNGNWAGEMKGKVNYEDFNFPGSLETVKFKILRYTESGILEGESESYPVLLKDPNPPTITPTIIPSSTPTPLPENTPTPIMTNSPTFIISPISNPTVSHINPNNSSASPSSQNLLPDNPLIFFSIWAGLSLLLIIAIFIYWRLRYKKR